MMILRMINEGAGRREKGEGKGPDGEFGSRWVGFNITYVIINYGVYELE